jgi:hypothetical protein
VVKKEYSPGDAAQNNMFILVEAGILCVCAQEHIWNIRLMSDASVGIHWIGSGAVRNAAFMLVREVSVRVAMVYLGAMLRRQVSIRMRILILDNCQETSIREIHC